MRKALFNVILIFFTITLFCFIIHCSCNNQNTNDDNIINGMPIDKVFGDSYNVEGGSIKTEPPYLLVTVTYSGGCEEHEFKLKAHYLKLDTETKETEKLKVEFYIIHNANNDSCEAEITEDLKFNLAEIIKDSGLKCIKKSRLLIPFADSIPLTFDPPLNCNQ